MNTAEEAVAEELSLYKELLTTVVDHGAAATSCSVFTAAANLVTDEFLCDEF